MHSNLIKKVTAKKSELKQLHQKKRDLTQEQKDVQGKIDERIKSGKEPDQKLVNRSKDLPNEIMTNQSQISDTGEKLNQLEKERAKDLSKQFKGNAQHQKSPAPNNAQPKLISRLRPDNIRDWNGQNAPVKQKPNAQAIANAKSKAKEAVKSIDKSQIKQLEVERD